VLKELLETVESRIAMLASANLSLAGAGGLLVKLGPYLDSLVKVGQVAVAVVTVVYVINKTIAVRKARKDDE
jgi:hypothetical protein